MRRAARLVVLLGALGLGTFLFRSAPRDVVLVYGLGERAVDGVEVEIARGDQVVRRAELRPTGAPGALQHPVRLPDGDYRVRLRIAPHGGPAVRVERDITVRESGTIVLPLESAR